MTYCKEWLNKQQKINDLEEEIACLQTAVVCNYNAHPWESVGEKVENVIELEKDAVNCWKKMR